VTSKKRIGILAAIGAALGALMFWRRKKKQQEFFQT
jgi:LPXTG-motif cell wall-anchored protein